MVNAGLEPWAERLVLKIRAAQAHDADYERRSILHMAEVSARTGQKPSEACPFCQEFQPLNREVWMRAYDAKRAEMEAEKEL